VVPEPGTGRACRGRGAPPGDPGGPGNAGAIALVNRGTCPFTQKVRNAQTAGASAVIVINNQPGDALRMDGVDPAITIPSVMVSSTHGATIRTGLPATGTVTRIIPTGQ
jgi:PA domain-containing protein